MNKFLRHEPRSTLFALAAAAFLAFGSLAIAAPPTTICSSEDGAFCDLVISSPDSVAAGQSFTVKVGITDFGGNLVPPNDPCAKQVVVTLNVFITEGPPFATYTANASKGVATFNVAGLPPTTFAELDASAVQTGGACSYEEEFKGITVVTVAAGQPIAPCPPDVSCTQTTSGSGSAGTLFANDGSFTAAFVPRVDNCGGGGPLDPNGVLQFSYFGTSPKTIIIALSPDLVTKGIGRYNICWKPDAGTAFYLPSCNHSAPPCVDSKTSGQHNSAFFTILAPPGDPQVYPE